MEKFERALDQMGTDMRQTIDRLRADMREQHQVVGESLDRQEQAITVLQGAVAHLEESAAETKVAITGLQGAVAHLEESATETKHGITELREAVTQTNRAVIRQDHILDQGLANAADTWERHRENVGNAVHSYVDDMNALKTEVRGLSSRVDALERRTPPAA